MYDNLVILDIRKAQRFPSESGKSAPPKKILEAMNDFYLNRRPERRTSLAGFIFQNVAGLAAERLANSLKRGEANGARLVVFENRQVRHRDIHFGSQLGKAHFSFGHHDVEIDNYGHSFTSAL